MRGSVWSTLFSMLYLFSVSVSEFVVPPNFSVSRKRSTSNSLECEQHKKTKVGMEVPPVKAVTMPKKKPYKEVLAGQEQSASGSRRSAAARQTIFAWTSVHTAAWKRKACNTLPTARRTSSMRVARGLVGGPTDEAGIIGVLAENACDGGGYRRLELTETSEGYVLADEARLVDRAERAHDNHGAQERDDEGSCGQVHQRSPNVDEKLTEIQCELQSSRGEPGLDIGAKVG